MATTKRVAFSENGEPVVTLTVTGWSDTFRFAWALAHLQTDFADAGRRIGGSLKRKLGAQRFGVLQGHYTGNEHPGWIRDGDLPCGRCCNPDTCAASGECEKADHA